MVFTAKTIGNVYANVSSISNYPSLFCATKAGGKITHVSSSGNVTVSFLIDDPSCFSETFKAHFMECSKTLCKLRFNRYEDNSERSLSSEQISDAEQALRVLIEQTDNRLQRII